MRCELERVACLLVCCLAWSSELAAQVPSLNPPQQQVQQLPDKSKDTLGRDTPRGTVLGFTRAAQESYRAMEYLQLSEARKKADAPSLVDYLRQALDCCFSGPLGRISDAENGSLNPDLPLTRSAQVYFW